MKVVAAALHSMGEVRRERERERERERRGGGGGGNGEGEAESEREGGRGRGRGRRRERRWEKEEEKGVSHALNILIPAAMTAYVQTALHIASSVTLTTNSATNSSIY